VADAFVGVVSAGGVVDADSEFFFQFWVVVDVFHFLPILRTGFGWPHPRMDTGWTRRT
jgi:hypothetical protein